MPLGIFSALILPFCHRSSSAFFPLSTIRFCETTSFILLYMFFLFCFIPFSVFASPVAANGPQCPLTRCARYPLCTHFFRFHSVYAYGKYFHVSAKFCALTKELHIHHHKAYFLYVYKTVEAAASPKMEHTKLCDMCLIMNAYENSRSFIHKHIGTHTVSVMLHKTATATATATKNDI